MTVDAPNGIDAFELALAFLKHPADAPLYVEHGNPAAGDGRGWRLILDAASGVPVVAARGARALLDSSRVSTYDLAGLVVNAVLGVQRGLLFLHAASLGVRRGGLLLIGPTRSGKTTTALSLASRGHAYFGDDMAVIRSATGELMPFWRTAHIRPGPHARALSSQIESGQWDPPYRDGLPRLRVRVAELFPQAANACTPLRAALFLRGFADAPRVEYFEPAFASFGGGSRFAMNNTLWVAWGTTPALRLMQFMIFLRLLCRLRCGWLDVGEPDATADLIENTMEETCASP